MSNWRDPVEGRDFDLPPRPKDDEVVQSKQPQSNKPSAKSSLIVILSGLSLFLVCGVIGLNIFIASQVNGIASFIEQNGVLNPTLAPTLIETPIPTPTPIQNMLSQERFRDPIVQKISLKDGELIIGTAEKFAVRAYGCNTIDTKENTPYTVFLIMGPIETEVEIYNGGWDYWANVYDDTFVKQLLESKRDEVRKQPNYLVVHVECIILPNK